MAAKILLVDDDIELIELLAELLSLEYFTVEVANNGAQALEKLDDSYDLVLLDVMMPVLGGIETLKLIRARSSVPVIMLTARGEDIDRILGLELGADDYIPKPFNDRELVARVKAILRRTKSSDKLAELKSVKEIEFRGMVLSIEKEQAYCNGQDLELTITEFALLKMLVLNPNRVLSRETLSQEVLDKSFSPFDRAIDVHMSNLRKKLSVCDNGVPWFKTLRGRGYVLVSPKD